ncbi:hypothetical protein SH668x_003059 [Planctomicrobium sp. SH668]|uniref:hypothetical protein n=1 Tax=Planctomicrobium sp. SH668 TaxID=3448126 RepID=UPI003F5B53E0
MPMNHHNSENPTLSIDGSDEDYEIITSDEVDRILDGLDQLIASTNSENIRSTLEEAADAIFSLVYSEDAEAGMEDDQEEAA